MSSCLFCNIVAKSVPAQIVFEDAHTVAFRDIRPVAPTHVLVVPRRHITGIHGSGPEDGPWLGHLMLTARGVAEQLGLSAAGYRLVLNEGVDGGQSVLHLHCHVLGGRPMAWPPG
ncbi:MAG: histidine triad nucleotide-binding protein [Polyangiaceae bacterium]|jgi:histidine triad (HIT) family protein